MQVNKNQPAPTLTDLARPQPNALKPRAIAVLLALRPCSLQLATIARYIGEPRDGARAAISGLVKDMEAMGLVHRAGDSVNLTHDGIAWLETNGLKAEYAP